MDRRTFLAGTGAALLAAPLTAAQEYKAGKVYRIGLLGGTPPPAEPRLWEGFFQELRERGYVEGRNLIFDGRWYGDHTEQLPALAAELVRLKVDVIVAGAAPAPEAAQRATSTIPIVMSYHPIRLGVGSRPAWRDRGPCPGRDASGERRFAGKPEQPPRGRFDRRGS